MNKPMLIAFLFSVVLHTFLYVGLNISKYQKPHLKKIVEFQLVNRVHPKNPLMSVKQLSNHSNLKQNFKKKLHSKKSNTQISTLNQLIPQFNPSPVSVPFAHTSTESKTGKAKGDHYDKYNKTGTIGFMNAMGVLSYIKHTPYLEATWQRVNLALDYPKDLYKERISGNVYIALNINHKGVFSKFLEIKGEQPLLNTYVAATLLQTLKAPMPSQYWLKANQEIPLQFTFKFDILAPHNERINNTGSVYKNALTFQRQKKLDYKINEDIHNFFVENKIPPILPIPGGFMVDLVLLYKVMASYGDKPTESSQRKARLKQFQQLLEQSIKKIRRPQTHTPEAVEFAVKKLDKRTNKTLFC